MVALHLPKHRNALARSWLLARRCSGFIWVGFICFVSLSLIFRNLFEGYDFSYDELYSALSVSSGSLRITLFNWVLPDTHPPLHALSLFLWRIIFGDSEVSLRMMSALFSILTLFVWGLFATCLNSLPLFAGLPFIALNPYFVFFSNEVRGYSGLIYASSLVLFSLLTRADCFFLRRAPLGPCLAVLRGIFSSNLFFAFALLQVSLFHYYGLLYAIVALLLDCFFSSSSFRFAVIGLSLILIWPIAHLVAFRSDQVSRISWLPSGSLEGALGAFVSSTLPGFRLYQLVALVFSLVVILIMEFSGSRRNKSQKQLSLAQLSVPLVFLVASFLIAITCLDLVKPIVLEKYFVVLLPATSLLLGVAMAVPQEVVWHLSARNASMLALPLSLFAAFYLESIRSYQTKAFQKVDSKVSYTTSQTFDFLRKSKVCELACAVGPGLMANSQAGDSRGMALSRYGLANGFNSVPTDESSIGFVSTSLSMSTLGLIPMRSSGRLTRVYLEGFDLGGSLAQVNSSKFAESRRLRQRGYECFEFDKNSVVKIWAVGSVHSDLDFSDAGLQKCF